LLVKCPDSYDGLVIEHESFLLPNIGRILLLSDSHLPPSLSLFQSLEKVGAKNADFFNPENANNVKKRVWS
jgi:hypothetical protein